MHTRRVYSKASDAKTPLSLVNRPARPGKNAPTSLPNVHYLCYGVILLQYFCGELPFECLYDLNRLNFLSDMQRNSINSAIEIRVLTYYVLSMEGMALIAVAERHLSGSILLCWFVAAKPSTYCKYSLYSICIFAIYLCDE